MSDAVLPDWPQGRVGYVAIVGRPNVGKSTFLNQVLDYHLAAISARPQTTRRHWRGILSDAGSQVIFVDTPGIHRGKTELGKVMLESVRRSLKDADVVMLMADPTRPPGAEDELSAVAVADVKVPLVLVLNKCDASSPGECDATRRFYLERLPGEPRVFDISALTGKQCDDVLAWLRQQLPEGPFFYPPDQVSDAFEREIGAELIREAALPLLREEVPHTLAVEIEAWKDRGKALDIRATLYVEQESQKGIVIGRGGRMIKRIREGAEQLLTDWQEKPAHVALFVKVARDWRNRAGFLREIGLRDGA